MRAGRAVRVATAAAKTVEANPVLAEEQRKAWAEFTARVWPMRCACGAGFSSQPHFELHTRVCRNQGAR